MLRVALARVKMIQGKRMDAIAELERAEDLGAFGIYAGRANAAIHYLGMGEWERTAELGRTLSDADLNAMELKSSTLLATGDMAGLRQFLDGHQAARARQSADLRKFLTDMEDAGVVEFVAGHQQTVNRLVRPFQCGQNFQDSESSDWDHPIWFDNLYVNLGIDDALDLSQAVTRALCDYYESQGQPPGRWVGVFQPDIIPLETVRA